MITIKHPWTTTKASQSTNLLIHWKMIIELGAFSARLIRKHVYWTQIQSTMREWWICLWRRRDENFFMSHAHRTNKYRKKRMRPLNRSIIELHDSSRRSCLHHLLSIASTSLAINHKALTKRRKNPKKK